MLTVRLLAHGFDHLQHTRLPAKYGLFMSLLLYSKLKQHQSQQEAEEEEEEDDVEEESSESESEASGTAKELSPGEANLSGPKKALQVSKAGHESESSGASAEPTENSTKAVEVSENSLPATADTLEGNATEKVAVKGTKRLMKVSEVDEDVADIF